MTASLLPPTTALPGGLTVLYDPGCLLCLRCRHWLARQPKYLPMRFVAQGTEDAGRRFPQLDVGTPDKVEDLIVVSDDGKVYRNTRAWIMCFYALREYRPLAFRLSHPTLMPLARRAYQAIANNRMWLSRWFGKADRNITNDELADRIKTHTAPTDNGCHTPTPGSNPATFAACAVAPDNVTASVVKTMNDRRTNDQPEVSR
ncbi:MAG: DUF393 domain-containing protein [Planctomycetota bacterium]